ncbi:hypothetical protein [Moorena bouillonii]|uniref:ColD n=1 Tax=Moorena bouillonii PNG TaxID=568701 RepID=A0A0H4TJJ9_9CYAN|nr:hypothetical protein [Moorena bouillonii]AKQ09581.1 ColD [Moorena bouillonii PNG]
MIKTVSNQTRNSQASNLEDKNNQKHFTLIERTFNSNVKSDYTEKIEELGKNFNYQVNRDFYWSDPELSVLYGTPIYQAASPSQKIALNHLFWVAMYNGVAANEAATILYNQVTRGVFVKVGGYETLCRELETETNQEHYHVKTFQKVGYKTKQALLGKALLKNSFQSKWYKSQKQRRLRGNIVNLLPKKLLLSLDWDKTWRWTVEKMLPGQKNYRSQYLEELVQRNEPIPGHAEGIIGRLAPRQMQPFFAYNWGSSPFFSCQYYTMRYIANANLKNKEYSYFKYFKDLHKGSEFIPTPTAISHFHLLDESFHTTISQTIARDLYKDFSPPTAYEKFVANMAIYMMQHNVLSGISCIFPSECVTDEPLFMLLCYKILRSPIFGMSSDEALNSMQQSLCQENEGFHVTLKYHQRLLSDLRRFFNDIDYLWPVNREMRLMDSAANIDRAIQANIKSFKQFAKSVA